MSYLRPYFFFDLGSPDCWLAAEQLHRLFGAELVWRPTSGKALAQTTGNEDWGLGPLRELGMSRIAERAFELELGAIYWPHPWPNDSCRAMRVAVYAEAIGMCEPFALSAFRLQFLEGQRLADWHVIATAVSGAGLPGRAALDAPLTELFKQRLRRLTARALDLGVRTLPAVNVGGRLFHGEETVVDAHSYWRSLVETSLSDST